MSEPGVGSGLEPGDFRHSGCVLRWGEGEHAPDAFEVFSLAVSRDGSIVAAGGASPSTPGVAHVRAWRVVDDDSVSSAPSTSRASTSSHLVAALTAEGAVAALAVAVSPAGDAVFAGAADGSLWAWDLPSGALRFHVGGGASEEMHPALARLPRRRRFARNPFARQADGVGARSDGREPVAVRRLRVVPDPDAASPAFALIGAAGGFGVLPCWDPRTGFPPDFDRAEPAAFRDDPLVGETPHAACHLAVSGDGGVVYAVSVDAKALRAWRLRDDGAGRRAGEVVWRSARLAVRDVYLAGLAVLDRSGPARSSGFGGALLATCAANVVDGTTYAEPDAPLRVVLVDALGGSEIRRFPLEGVRAGGSRFFDCASLATGGGGGLLFLACKDGSVTAFGARNGAVVAEMHPHGRWASTSGHHRLLPACVAVAPGEARGAREYLWSATTDGGRVDRWRVGAPPRWTTASHARFPRAFRKRVEALVLSTRVCAKREEEEEAIAEASASAGGSASEARDAVAARYRRGAEVLAAGPMSAEAEAEDGRRSLVAPDVWGAGFAAVCAVEPAILELVVERMARLEHACEEAGGEW